MVEPEVLIIGAGPAGLKAALSAAEQGADVLLVDRNPYLGGQLVKQTHMFFGSQKQYASERGVTIADILTREAFSSGNIQVLTDTTVLGYFEDKAVALETKGFFRTVYPKRVIVATGAQENTQIGRASWRVTV